MKKLLLVFYLASITSIVTAQKFSLLKDIYPGTGSSNICYLTNVDNKLFFAANNGVNGMELWKSDGTDAGTVLVKDIRPGTASSSIGYLTHVNHKLFFVANDGVSGNELWKSDGTPEGTVMVKNIRPGSLSSNPSGLVNINGILYFSADDGVNGVELWKSDGTEAGTVMVKNINPYSGSSYPQAMANINGYLFFAATDGTKGIELWKSDGTAAGTVLVKDIYPGSNDSYPFDLINVGSTLFFSADNGANGTELWKSDGTTAGTSLVKDIWTGVNGSFPFSLRNVNGLLFFSADNGSKGTELWKSDGTAAGTVLVKDVWPGAESGAVGNFSKVLNKLIFTGNDGVNGYKTWESDGSSSGTMIVQGVGDPGDGDMQELVETDNHIFASIRQSDLGRELWVIDYSSVLPLQLVEFKGRLENEDALLNWKTTHEENTDEFIIERSVDGVNFNPVGNVLSNNTPGTHHYAFTDAGATRLKADLIYYRLKQRDIDGRFTYSKIVSIAIVNKTGTGLYPNPAINEINLSILAERKEKIDFQLIDNAGHVVMQESKQVSPGSNILRFDLHRLPAGIYYIRSVNRSFDKSLRFLKY